MFRFAVRDFDSTKIKMRPKLRIVFLPRLGPAANGGFFYVIEFDGSPCFFERRNFLLACGCSLSRWIEAWGRVRLSWRPGSAGVSFLHSIGSVVLPVWSSALTCR